MKKVVVCNLNNRDYDEKNLLNFIAHKIVEAMGRISEISSPSLRPPTQDTVFSFPKDPSVESPHIPVLIDVELINEGTQIDSTVAKQLAEFIRAGFRATPGNTERIVWVVVKAYDNGEMIRIGTI